MIANIFFICGFSKFLLDNTFLKNAKGLPSCIKIELISTLELSLLMISVLQKLGMTKNGVEQIDSFSQWKYSSPSSIQRKKFSLSKDVNGVQSFHNSLQTYDNT